MTDDIFLSLLLILKKSKVLPPTGCTVIVTHHGISGEDTGSQKQKIPPFSFQPHNQLVSMVTKGKFLFAVVESKQHMTWSAFAKSNLVL